MGEITEQGKGEKDLIGLHAYIHTNTETESMDGLRVLMV